VHIIKLYVAIGGLTLDTYTIPDTLSLKS